MFERLKHLLLPNGREAHADDLRDKTHEVMNDIQKSILKHQSKSRKDKERIIQILSDSEQELNSVAQRIAVATGKDRRIP